MAAENGIIAKNGHPTMTDESQKDTENCCADCRPKRKGCIKLGTGKCDCDTLCAGDRYKILVEQKDKNELREGQVIVYISGGGLAFCAHAAADYGVYIIPGLVFVLVIIAMTLSFEEGLREIDKAMKKADRGEENPKGVAKLGCTGVARWLFFVALFFVVLSAAYTSWEENMANETKNTMTQPENKPKPSDGAKPGGGAGGGSQPQQPSKQEQPSKHDRGVSPIQDKSKSQQ